MNTKYLNHFYHQLRNFREQHRLSHEDVAKCCLVDVSVVAAWESENSKKRCYPSLDNLLDLCFKTGAALEQFIDLPKEQEGQQLDLPGLTVLEESDLSETLNQLDEQLNRLMPQQDEVELLRRFRKSNKENRELILQLIGS